MKIGNYDACVLSGGLLRLDGGTMFGPVPRVLWEKQAIPDERHRITMDTNCLLLRSDDHRILIDTGYGSKADPKQRDLQGLEEGDPIGRSLAAVGLHPNEIDVVILTHLHFDHVGGCTRRTLSGQIELVFPNAFHFVQNAEWEDATGRLPELLGSYFEEDFLAIESAGKLRLLSGEAEILPGIRVRSVGGHTRGLQMVDIEGTEPGSLAAVVLTDLAPTVLHLRTFWQPSYDQFPLEVRRAKPKELGRIADTGALAFFCHDTAVKWAYLKRDPKREFIAEQGL